MLVVTGIEAEVLACRLRCACGHQFVESDFQDIDNVVELRCRGCGATALKIVFGGPFARLFFNHNDVAKTET